jgi:hypothetical protein
MTPTAVVLPRAVEYERVSDASAADGAATAHAFFKGRRAAAVLKHAILRSYLHPFVAKTGSTSQGHRVAILDGFAGTGRYADGEPGSPQIIANAAETPALRDRRIEAIFVEADRATFQQLCAVLSEVAGRHDLPDSLRPSGGLPRRRVGGDRGRTAPSVWVCCTGR